MLKISKIYNTSQYLIQFFSCILKIMNLRQHLPFNNPIIKLEIGESLL